MTTPTRSPLVSEIFNADLTLAYTATEDQFRTTCPKCGLQQRLAEATLDRADPLELKYLCHRDQAVILIVSTPGVVPWEGRGYRLKNWTIRNPTDLHHDVPNGAVVLIPASIHALD